MNELLLTKMDLSNWQLTSWMVLVFFIINYMISRVVIYRSSRNMLLHFDIPGSTLLVVICSLILNIVLNTWSSQYKSSETVINKERKAINNVLIRLKAFPDSVSGIFSSDLSAYLSNRMIYFAEGQTGYEASTAKLKADSLADGLWIRMTGLKKNPGNRMIIATLTSGLDDLFAIEARRAGAGLTRYIADLFFIMSLTGILMILGMNQQHAIRMIKKQEVHCSNLV